MKISSLGQIVTISPTVKQNVKSISPIQNQGAGLVEFALLVALIAVIAIISVKALGYKTADKFCNVGGNLQDTSNPNLHFNPDTGQCEDSTLEN
jgi:Flp pilus assembly pilin Flp